MSHAMRELLEFYIASGVDCALEDTPQDRFAESALALVARNAPVARQSNSKALQTPAQKTGIQAAGIAQSGMSGQSGQSGQAVAASQGFNEAPARPIQRTEKIPVEEIVASAQALAEKAGSLEELQNALSSFEGCNLKRLAKNTVFSDGNPKAKIMLVGEAPGRDDEYYGLPFSGPAGQFLNQMLGSIGLDRTSVYFAHIVPWRPPGELRPTASVTRMCRPFIERQIELVDPDILVLVGEAAAKNLTGRSENIVQLRGRWTTYKCNDRDMLTMPIFHPDYLLRAPAQKRLAWQDLLTIKRKLDEVSSVS